MNLKASEGKSTESTQIGWPAAASLMPGSAIDALKLSGVIARRHKYLSLEAAGLDPSAINSVSPPMRSHTS